MAIATDLVTDFGTVSGIKGFQELSNAINNAMSPAVSMAESAAKALSEMIDKITDSSVDLSSVLYTVQDYFGELVSPETKVFLNEIKDMISDVTGDMGVINADKLKAILKSLKEPATDIFSQLTDSAKDSASPVIKSLLDELKESVNFKELWKNGFDLTSVVEVLKNFDYKGNVKNIFKDILGDAKGFLPDFLDSVKEAVEGEYDLSFLSDIFEDFDIKDISGSLKNVLDGVISQAEKLFPDAFSSLEKIMGRESDLLSVFKDFDIKDIPGSLKHVINGIVNRAEKLFPDIFGSLEKITAGEIDLSAVFKDFDMKDISGSLNTVLTRLVNQAENILPNTLNLLGKITGKEIDLSAFFKVFDFKDISDSLQNALNGVVSKAESNFPEVVNTLKELMGKDFDLSQLFENFDLKNIFHTLKSHITNILPNSLSDLKGLLIKELDLSELIETVSNIDFKDFADSLKNSFNDVVTKAKDMLPQGRDALKEVFKNGFDSKSLLDTVKGFDFQNISGSLKNIFGNAFGQAKGIVPEAVNALKEVFNSSFDSSALYDAVKNFDFKNISGSFKGIFTGVKEIFASPEIDTLMEGVQNIGSVASPVINNIKNVIKNPLNAVNTIKDKFKGLFGGNERSLKGQSYASHSAPVSIPDMESNPSLTMYSQPLPTGNNTTVNNNVNQDVTIQIYSSDPEQAGRSVVDNLNQQFAYAGFYSNDKGNF